MILAMFSADQNLHKPFLSDKLLIYKTLKTIFLQVINDFFGNIKRKTMGRMLCGNLVRESQETHGQILTLSVIQTLSEASVANGFQKTQLQEKKLLRKSNFSFCHNVFHFQSQVIHSIIEIFYLLTKYVQSRLLQNCHIRERVIIFSELVKLIRQK